MYFFFNVQNSIIVCKVKIMLLRVMFFSGILFSFLNLNAQTKAFHIGGGMKFSSSWILNQNNYGTLDGFNNVFARRSELDYATTFGGGAGVVGGYFFTKKHSLDIGLYFDKAGQKYKDEIFQDIASTNYRVEVKRNIKLNYIKVPVLYTFNLVNERRSIFEYVNYYFSVGPQVSALISVYEEVDIDDPDIKNNLDNVKESEKIRNFDIGLTFNNGVRFRLNKQLYFNVGIDVYIGLIDINGKTIRDLAYFSKNDVEYKPSHNFNVGLNAGVHYIFTSKAYY